MVLFSDFIINVIKKTFNYEKCIFIVICITAFKKPFVFTAHAFNNIKMTEITHKISYITLVHS